MGCENLVTVSAFNNEIKALRAEIAELKKQQNNPNNLIQKIKDGLLTDGNWKKALVGGLLIGGIRIDQYFTPERMKAASETFDLRRKVANLEQSQKYFNDFQKSANLQLKEKTRLIEAVDKRLGRVTNTANSALSKANKVDDIADGLNDISKRVNSVKGAINTTARRVDSSTSIANRALSTANGASKQAGTAAAAAGAAGSKAAAAAALGSKLFAALGAIGGAAGLIALYGYFRAVRPTLNAHDRRLDEHDRAFSGVYSAIGRVDGRARAAQSTATAAQSTANDAKARSITALNTANKAQATATNATNIATGADGRAKAAQDTANKANTTAQDASRKADKAIDIAIGTQQDLDKYKRDQSKMDQSQVNRLSSEHRRIERLINNIPAQFKEPNRVPYELLGIPALIRGQNSTLNQISRNTSPQNLRQRAAEGTCQTMQPGGCGDKAISRHTNPLKSLLDRIMKRLDAFNVALSARVSAQISGLQRSVSGISSKMDKLQNTMLERFGKLWNYMKMDRVLNIITTAAVVHNAAMLSRNLAVSLVDTIGETLGIIGLKDADGNAYNIGEILSSNAEAFVVSIVGQEYYEELSDKWHKSNRIISAAAGVVMALRSVQWAIAEGIETIGTWIARIGNGLEDEGVVSDKKWPWMNEREVNIGKFAGLNKFNEGLETAEEITENIYMTVAAGEEIKESVTLARESTTTFNETLAQEDATETEAQTQRETDSDSPEPTPDDLAEFEPESEA